jgi:hypothetical protein
MRWREAVAYDRDTVESGSPSVEDILRLDLSMLSQLVHGLLTSMVKIWMYDSQDGTQY